MQRSMSRISFGYLREYAKKSIRIHGPAEETIGNKGCRYNGEHNFYTPNSLHRHYQGSHRNGDYCMACPLLYLLDVLRKKLVIY
jgi:hypothetical protein